MQKIHTVTVEWWVQGDTRSELPKRHEAWLEAAAFEQVAERLKEGYREGELTAGAGTYQGYWSIETEEVTDKPTT